MFMDVRNIRREFYVNLFSSRVVYETYGGKNQNMRALNAKIVNIKNVLFVFKKYTLVRT